MTVKEFFRKARRGRTWALYNDDVRCAKGFCPLGAVIGNELTPDPQDAAKALGLRSKVAHRIADAADGFGTERDLNWLLKNLNA